MKLTNKKVDQLSLKEKNYIVWDSEVKGFGVRVNLNNKKTFIVKYRVGSGRSAKVRKPVIGTYGVMKVEEAQALGLVKHKRGERVLAKNQPNSYTLTFYATENMYPPTNDWKKLTEEQLISFRNKTKQQKKKRAEFKERSRM